MGHDHKYMGHETANWGGRELGYMLFNAHLCNQPYTVRGVGSESRDVDAWTQTSLYVKDRGAIKQTKRQNYDTQIPR
jgi:hypothetical protein